MKLPKLLLFFALLLGTLTGLAQPQTDVKVIPSPEDVFAYRGQTSNKSVKQITWISDFNKNNGDHKDTIRVTEYDREGRVSREVSYYSGKRGSITEYSYPQKNVTIWRSQNLRNTRAVTVCTIVNDRWGKPDYHTIAEIYNGDTTSRSGARFTYNKDSLVVKREEILNGKVYMIKNYHYKNKRLVLAEIKTENGRNTSWLSFIYNKDHQAEKQIQYHQRGDVIDSTWIGTYNYSGKNLASHTRTNGVPGSKNISTIYTYDKQNRISGTVSTQDTLYQKLTYNYRDKYIDKVTVSSNTSNLLSPGFYMLFVNPLTKLPLEDVTAYFYDAKGHLVKTEETLNGVLQSRHVYNITYY